MILKPCPVQLACSGSLPAYAPSLRTLRGRRSSLSIRLSVQAIKDKIQAHGIKIILDISGTPAPIWLHRRYPGVDIVNQNSERRPPAERYTDNISDPNSVREVAILADAMIKRYSHHPVVIAVGYDNEIDNGFMSYSAADRRRFITWLRYTPARSTANALRQHDQQVEEGHPRQGRTSFLIAVRELPGPAAQLLLRGILYEQPGRTGVQAAAP